VHLLPASVSQDAAEQANRRIQASNYGVLAGYYEQGGMLPHDNAKALKWYRRAAELGDLSSEWNLGRMLESGSLSTADAAEAAKWYRKVADQGPSRYEVLSQLALGRVYSEGRGVSPDGFEALKWYQRAAENGSTEAIAGIAQVWATGKGVPKNSAEAVKWYKLAAAKGDITSLIKLGELYFKGDGVPVDYIEAQKWYILAAAGGSQQATELRDSSAAGLNADQITEAQRRSIEFLTTKFSDITARRGSCPTSTHSPKASGSGFFITHDGYLLTNAKTVEDAGWLLVKTSSGEFPASLVKADAANDIAVLKVSGAFHPVALIPSRAVKLGDSVTAIGFPSSHPKGAAPKLEEGKVNGLSGAQDDPRELQINAAIQSSNYGGALLNTDGNVIGMLASRHDDAAQAKAAYAMSEGINYAIKSSYVLSLLESLPEVTDKLVQPSTIKSRKPEEALRQAQEATALVQAF
jgi:TPR repeat protein